RPERAVQCSILDRLGYVLRLELRNRVKVCDGAGDFQDAVVGAGAEALMGHGAFQQAFAIGGEFAEFANELGRHLRVAIELLASSRKARQLNVTRSNHTPENRGGIL